MSQALGSEHFSKLFAGLDNKHAYFSITYFFGYFIDTFENCVSEAPFI